LNWENEFLEYIVKHPFLFLRFDKEDSLFIEDTRCGLSRFSITARHNFFKNLRTPTICIFYLHNEYRNKTGLFLGITKSKRTVSTFDSGVKIIDGARLNLDTPDELAELIKDKRSKNLFLRRIQESVAVLSPKLSAIVISCLLSYEENKSFIETLAYRLNGFKSLSYKAQFQINAVQLALAAFGLDKTEEPLFLTTKRNSDSTLKYINGGHRLTEDNIISHDARWIPGFKLIESYLTGHAVFENRDERLEVFTANRNDLEKMFGVDLIYINTIQKSVVMVQYKMLEKSTKKEDLQEKDWIYRPDQQFYDEMKRMSLLSSYTNSNDYRLNSNPFYLKFVSRIQGNGSPEGFVISLDHFKHLSEKPESKGERGGIRLSYNILNGTYLRESDFLGLIRSGYIGTHSEDSQHLAAIINSVIEGEKAIVLAWQRKNSQNNVIDNNV
jgi:hypothetical protein